jgi:hypothetical protein
MTAAAMSLRRAAVATTWLAPNDVPHNATREASSSGLVRMKAKAASMSSK